MTTEIPHQKGQNEKGVARNGVGTRGPGFISAEDNVAKFWICCQTSFAMLHDAIPFGLRLWFISFDPVGYGTFLSC